MLLRLWNYLRGYVIIIVDGYFVEKFINICARRQIRLWDVRAQQGQLVTMKMDIKGFKNVRPVARKTKCRVRLLKKVGLPFVFNRYRGRKAFFAGALLFFVTLFVISSFVWSVEIKGNEKLKTEELEEILARYGIKTGVLKYSIDTDKTVSRVMIDVEDLSWISIAVKGTKVKVEVRERLKAPEIIPRHIPCDVVAKKDGIVSRIIATEGIEAVKAGDTVTEGQVLISGRIPVRNNEDKYRLVHAMGTVIARTWYEEEAPVITNAIERLRTGKVINNHSLVLFSWKLDIFHRKNKFKSYSVTEKRRQLSIGEDFVFPVEWITVSYIEEKLVEAVINEADAKYAAAETAYKKALAKVPKGAKVVRKNINYVQNGDSGLVAKASIECIEEIGESRKIGGN